MTDAVPNADRPGRTDAITVRLEPDVAARVAAAAEADGRTVSSFVRKVLLDRLAEGG